MQVLAIPAGGVPVGYVLAEKLEIPFDVVVVRKIPIPWNTEAGFGAVTWDGHRILNEPLVVSQGLVQRSWSSAFLEPVKAYTKEIRD